MIMWIARDKDGKLFLFTFVKLVRKDEDGCWVKTDCHSDLADSIRLDDNLFPQLTWDDEPMEVGLFPISADTDEELPTTIRLTTYYDDYDAHREWFFNMLKHQDNYKDCTDEEREKIWENHIHKDYDFDEIWDTVQYEGFTLISLKMNRYEHQPHHVKVCESKDYIDNILKKYSKGV